MLILRYCKEVLNEEKVLFGRLLKDVFVMMSMDNFVRYFILVGYCWSLCDLKLIYVNNFEMFFMIFWLKLCRGFFDNDSVCRFWSLLKVVGNDVSLFFFIFKLVIEFLFLLKVWLLIVLMIFLFSINVCNLIFLNVFVGICFNLLFRKFIFYLL